MSPTRFDSAEAQRRHTANTLIITGAPRSGTTLLGRLVSALGAIEYHHEPAMLWWACAMLRMKGIEPSVAATLIHVYLYEDLLLESVHGRKANLRPNDESLVLKSIDWTELLSRWNDVRNRAGAVRYMAERNLRLAIKLPSVLDSVPFLAQVLPQSQFVVISRDGREVVRSILKKQWLTDEGLRDNYWPYRMAGESALPAFVDDGIAGAWPKWNAATRACYLWRRDVELGLELQRDGDVQDRLKFVAYDALRKDPRATMVDLAGFVGAQLTDLTENGIRAVRPLREDEQTPGKPEFAAAVDATELRKFKELNERLGYGTW